MTEIKKAPLPYHGRPPKHAGRAVARLARQKRLDRRTWFARRIIRADGRGNRAEVAHA